MLRVWSRYGHPTLKGPKDSLLTERGEGPTNHLRPSSEGLARRNKKNREFVAASFGRLWLACRRRCPPHGRRRRSSPPSRVELKPCRSWTRPRRRPRGSRRACRTSPTRNCSCRPCPRRRAGRRPPSAQRVHAAQRGSPAGKRPHGGREVTHGRGIAVHNLQLWYPPVPTLPFPVSLSPHPPLLSPSSSTV